MMLCNRNIQTFVFSNPAAGTVCYIMPPDLWPPLSGTNVGSYTTKASTAEWGGSRTCGQQSHQGKRVVKKKATHGERPIRWSSIIIKIRMYFYFVLFSSHKILRQFEALMGGSPHAQRQDTVNSSHQAATNQPPTSTDSLLPTYSADNTNLNHYHPDILSAGVTQPQNHPSPPASPATAQRHSSGELTNDSDEENVFPIQQELLQYQLEPGRTAEVELVDEVSDFNTDGCSSPQVEPQCERPCVSRLSLFSGMELVTKGRPLCQRESHTTDDSLGENLAVNKSVTISKTRVDTPSICSSVASDSSQPVSAFSFLNFWPTAGTVS